MSGKIIHPESSTPSAVQHKSYFYSRTQRDVSSYASAIWNKHSVHCASARRVFATLLLLEARQAYGRGCERGGKDGELNYRFSRKKRSCRPFYIVVRSVDARLSRGMDMIALCFFFLAVVVFPHAAERDRPGETPLPNEKVRKRTFDTFPRCTPISFAEEGECFHRSPSSISFPLSFFSSLSRSITGRRYF